MFLNSEFSNNPNFFSKLGSMCNAACIDEATNRVHVEICIFSEFFDISELLSSCLSRSFMFWTTFLVCSRFPGAYAFLRDLQNLLNHTLGFPRHAEQNIIKFCVSFFPSQHLRVSCTPRAFRVTRIILSHRYAFTWNVTTCSCFRRWRSRRRAFLRSSRHLRLLSCGKKRMAVGKVAAGKKFATRHAWNYLFGRMSASWFLDSTYFIWIFASKFILSKPAQSHSVGAGHMSHRRACSLWWSP